MNVDPPIKEEDLDIDTSFQFSNLPDNPIDLTADDDDFGSDDDVIVTKQGGRIRTENSEY